MSIFVIGITILFIFYTLILFIILAIVKTKNNKYSSIVHKNLSYLSVHKKRIFSENKVSYLNFLSEGIGDRTYLNIHRSIKYYRDRNKWFENSFEEIPYFKIKEREQNFKELGI